MSVNDKLYGMGLYGVSLRPAVNRLKEKFTYPPFSVWNTRDGYWQERRRQWLALGIKSEVGRAEGLTYAIPETLSDGSVGRKIEAQTSVFDPMVCELAYRFWCPEGGVVVDPFAGGSVRGIVASALDRKYWGCDLRQEQVKANQEQATRDRCGVYKPRWVCGDSYEAVKDAPEADFVFSCPPYGDLEKYSDDPRDISTMGYVEFRDRYAGIIEQSCRRLRDGRFACFVVGNFRDPATGTMRDFVGDTVRAFEAAGLRYYNDIVLINSAGSAGMRTNGTFLRGTRKMVKCHQNVLVFAKGDPKTSGLFNEEI